MNYLSLILCLFFASNSLSFAQDLNGLWTGYLDQSAAASKIKGYKVYWDKGFWKKRRKNT
jgi:hypothetical protein